VLENVTFTDYLYIAPEVGEGTVHLRNVSAAKLIVAGGGLNSVIVEAAGDDAAEGSAEESALSAAEPISAANTFTSADTSSASAAEEPVRTAAENQAKLEELIPLMGWGTASDTADTADEIQSNSAAEESTDNSSAASGTETESASGRIGIEDVWLLSNTHLVLKVPVGTVTVCAGKLELLSTADAVFFKTPDSAETPSELKWQWTGDDSVLPELTLGPNAALRFLDLSGGNRVAVYNSGCVFQVEMGSGSLTEEGRGISFRNSGAAGTVSGGGFTYEQDENGYTQALNVTGDSILMMKGLADSLTVANEASGTELSLSGLKLNFLTLPEGLESAAEDADYKSASYTDTSGGVVSASSGAGDAVSYSSSDPVADLTRWRAINADVKAWIEIPGTNISYPIVKGETNTEYEELDYYRNYSKSGVIWFDHNVRFDQSGNLASKNTVIFGHNWTNLWRPIQYGRSSDIKFAQLAQYESASFAANHPYVYIYTDGGRQTYQVFAAFYCTVNTGLSTDFQYLTNDGTTDVAAIIEEEQNRSLYGTGISVASDDQIITLQTCTRVLGNSLGENQKFVVCAKLITGSGTESEAVVDAEEVTPRELTTSIKLAAKSVAAVEGAPENSLCIKVYVDENSISGIEITDFELTDVEVLSGSAEVGIVDDSHIYILPTAAGKVSVSYTAIVSFEGAGGSSDSQEVTGSISFTVNAG
jgi:SrtB family sortase